MSEDISENPVKPEPNESAELPKKPEKVSETGRTIMGLLGAVGEPVTLEDLSGWVEKTPDEVKNEIASLNLVPLTPVEELEVLLRVKEKEFSKLRKGIARKYGIEETKDIPEEYTDEYYNDVRRKVKWLNEDLKEVRLHPEEAKSRFDMPVYGLTNEQYERVKVSLDEDDDFMRYNGMIADSALRKINATLRKLGLDK